MLIEKGIDGSHRSKKRIWFFKKYQENWHLAVLIKRRETGNTKTRNEIEDIINDLTEIKMTKWEYC
jgi:hypothetical protein